MVIRHRMALNHNMCLRVRIRSPCRVRRRYRPKLTGRLFSPGGGRWPGALYETNTVSRADVWSAETVVPGRWRSRSTRSSAGFLSIHPQPANRSRSDRNANVYWPPAFNDSCAADFAARARDFIISNNTRPFHSLNEANVPFWAIRSCRQRIDCWKQTKKRKLKRARHADCAG